MSPEKSNNNERKPRAPNYGRPAEKVAREKCDPEFNYGGRRDRPDADMAERAARANPGAITGEGQAGGALFSSPLPDRAFPPGDLYDDGASSRVRAADRSRQGKGFRPRLAAGRLLKRLTGRKG